MAKLRKIEVDEHIADVLEARAEARGQSVGEVLAELVRADDEEPAWIIQMREEGRGPWSPEELRKTAEARAEFERTGMGLTFEEANAWVESLGTVHERPMPKPHKL